jgi:hypothetical protein
MLVDRDPSDRKTQSSWDVGGADAVGSLRAVTTALGDSVLVGSASALLTSDPAEPSCATATGTSTVAAHATEAASVVARIT